MAWARANFLLFDDPANGGALMYEFSDPEAQDPYSRGWTADVGDACRRPLPGRLGLAAELLRRDGRREPDHLDR